MLLRIAAGLRGDTFGLGGRPRGFLRSLALQALGLEVGRVQEVGQLGGELLVRRLLRRHVLATTRLDLVLRLVS